MMSEMDVAYWKVRYDKLKEDYADLNCHYAAALDKITELGNPWISVKDKLPEMLDDSYVSDVVLGYDSGRGAMFFTRLQENGFGQRGFDVEIPDDGFVVTHWMPLPTPPESEGDTE